MSEPGSVPLTTGRLRELVLGRLCQLDESEWLAPTELAEMQAQGLAALTSVSGPSMRTWRRSDFQWNSSAARGLARISAPLRLSALV